MKKSAGRRRMWTRLDPLTSLLLVFPLFLIYEVGVLLVPKAYNGADLITSQIVRLLHGQVGTYIALNAGLWAFFLGLVLWLRRSHSFEPRLVFPVLVESAFYALMMGSLICFVMVDLLHVDPRLAIGLDVAKQGPRGAVAALIVSLGAGVHEELIFRVLLIGGFGILLQKVFGLGRRGALTIAFLVSSILFSAAHHIIGGEAFRMGAFVYRILCGLFFACLYQWRGVAIAVYTHTLYDIYVFAVSSP